MKESYRGQCNLHLHFARQYLRALASEGDSGWGPHFYRAMAEAVLWQLQLAYRAHLADVVVQQPKFPQQLPEGSFFARDFIASSLPPEIIELADRELHTPWLVALVNETFLTRSGSATPMKGAQLIARDNGDNSLRDAVELGEWCQQLEEIVARHRATLMEY